MSSIGRSGDKTFTCVTAGISVTIVPFRVVSATLVLNDFYWTSSSSVLPPVHSAQFAFSFA